MAKVYEDFLMAALTQAFRPHGGWCRAQDRHYLDTDDEILMKPDLVWYRDGIPSAVVDAKYEAEKPAGFPDADLYQMLAYCTAGAWRSTPRQRKGQRHRDSAHGRHVGISIHAHTLDLATPPSGLLLQVDELADRIAMSTSHHFSSTGGVRPD
jgi:5-methylcytosine-specific restriction enzyme subunit McrC